MQNTEARKILGLDPDDDPRAFLPAFEETREFKRELVANAPSDEIKFRYQQELLEYEAAVKVVAGKQKARPHTDFIVVLMLIAAFSAVGWWGYQWYQQQWNAHEQTEVQIAQLQLEGRTAVIGRKWQQAEDAFQKIDELDPGSPIAVSGRIAIERGKKEESSQQLFYTLGESQAALEAGRWDEAEKLSRKVLTLDSENTSAKRKLEIIAEGRRKQEIAVKMLAITESLDRNDLTAARKAISVLRESDPQNPNISGFVERVTNEENKIKKAQEKAVGLLAEAKKLDTGEYSPEAMTLLDEARRLFPSNKDILSLHKKMGAYNRSINVPVDFPTISKAIEAARPNDLIRIAAGTYKESLVVNKPVRLEGAAEEKTIIELPGKEASLLTITSEAAGANVASIVFRHTGFDHGKDRFSGITIMAADVAIRSCTIHHAAGHGIAVLDGARAEISGCKITLCSWDGISVYGENSRADIKDSLCEGNLQHGVNFWSGGSGSVNNSRLLKSGLCGVVAMSEGTEVKITSCTSSNNREAGILVSDGVKAVLNSNKCEKNLLSGIVIRGKGTHVSMNGNLTKDNQEAGILTHKGVVVGEFENNRSSGNTSRQIWRDAELK
ncbi:MAG: right-handed parallel beta-helix repeat-containing protein [Akkermansiaceae bacterium]